MTRADGKHLTIKNGKYYLRRRVPRQYQSVDSRRELWVSLNTDSLSAAQQKAKDVWANLEAGWEARMEGKTDDEKQYFEAVQKIARSKGVKYMPMSEVMNLPDREILSRIESIGMQNKAQMRMEADALLGTLDIPDMKVSDALEEYWELAKDQTLGKSPDQIRRWENPRKKAFRNFIDVCGDKPISEVSRDDMVDFRHWWMERVQNEGRDPSTANKDFTHFGGVLKKVNEMKKLGLDLPLGGLDLKEGKENRRLPFSERWIREKLLAEGALDGLNLQARTIFLAMINTGARLSEMANLMPDHIALDNKYPHISITAKGREEARQLKSKHSERIIPLVGVSLDAMKNCPDGFPRYRDKSASLSAVLGKYLATHGLKETDEHTTYGLRHSFEDRLRLAKIDDRVRAELFGHSYHRERYGITQLPELTDALRQAAIL